jgi:hypothetical protein
MAFNNWLDTFIEEKNIDTERTFEVEGASGWNLIPVGCIVEAIKGAPKNEQQSIKTTFVKIDFHNGDVYHFFNHLAGAIAQ